MMVKNKKNTCPIDIDPLHCWVREQCMYWNRDLAGCGYRAVKDNERKQRRAEGFDGSAVMERIKINR